MASVCQMYFPQTAWTTLSISLALPVLLVLSESIGNRKVRLVNWMTIACKARGSRGVDLKSTIVLVDRFPLLLIDAFVDQLVCDGS